MKKRNIKFIMIIFIFLLIGSMIIKQKKVIKLKEQEETNITFAYVVDGEKQNTIPSKEGYTFDTENSSCTNGVTISWNYSNWNAKISNLKNTKSNCTLYFKKEYAEKILNGALPEIKGDLVPITIDDNGVVRKADLSSEWYSYQQKRWANAVILIDKTKEYKNNEEIKEENIESYFVWIPRYRYQLKENESTYANYKSIEDVGNVNNVGEFYENKPNKASNNAYEIVFEDKNTPRMTENTQNGWLSHPAFVSFDSNGFWVGKFETGYNQNENTESLINDKSKWSREGSEQNIKDASKIIIKPNVYSWRNIQIANAFYTSYEYQRDLESHMMKNMEWGAVVYLTQSNYGRCANGTCTEIRINNADNYITGMSAKSEPTCGWIGSIENCNYSETVNGLGIDGTTVNNYNNPDSVASSTTGNYTGIYDMSGGAWDYVMGVMKASANSNDPVSGKDKDNNSGFNGPYTKDSTNGTKTDGLAWPSNKYYDLYDYNSSNQEYQRGQLGDATKEFGPFYLITYLNTPGKYISSYNADWAYFVNTTASWFAHGGSRRDGTDAGIYAFNTDHGGKYTKYSFRIILTP